MCGLSSRLRLRLPFNVAALCSAACCLAGHTLLDIHNPDRQLSQRVGVSRSLVKLPQFNMLLISILLSVAQKITPSLTWQTNEFAIPAAASRQPRVQGQGTMF